MLSYISRLGRIVDDDRRPSPGVLIMNPVTSKKDRETFLKSLMLWDRPERDLFGRPLAKDTDTDAFLDRFFTSNTGG
jgi:hypothetical protein